MFRPRPFFLLFSHPSASVPISYHPPFQRGGRRHRVKLSRTKDLNVWQEGKEGGTRQPGQQTDQSRQKGL